jgi:ABC-2 type transport system ATP-binding protein
MSVASVIETRNLTRVFRDFWGRPRVRAVDGVGLEVRRGEIFGLLGPNGSGKSTTIKMLLGLLRPTSGKARVLGGAPSDVRLKHRLGYLPEESYLYPFLSGRETLEFYGRIFSLGRAVRRERADSWLRRLGLAGAGDRRVGEYSRGMQRRLGLAQALVNDPELLILDEPTAGLDPVGNRDVKDLLLELRDAGKTVLLSSHLLADVESICDRVAILHRGKLRAMGAVAELLAEDRRTQITTSRLAGATVAELREVIARREGPACEVRVEAPATRLEEFFLRTVEEAPRGAPAGRPPEAKPEPETGAPAREGPS